MPTEESSLEEVSVAVDAEPPASNEPETSDKSREGAENQAEAEQSTTPSDDPVDQPNLTQELLGDEADPEQPPKQDEKAESQSPPPADDQKPPAEKQEQANGEQKPADDDDELTPEQEQAIPKPVRGRIKNLKRKLEEERTQRQSALAALSEFEARATGAGYEKADEILEAIDLYGRALKKRDQSAIDELRKRIGVEPAPQGPQPDWAKIQAALKAYDYDAIERMANEASQAKSPASEPAKQPEAAAKPPATAQLPQQPAAQPQANTSPVAVQAVGEMKALADEVRSQHGADAEAILKAISTEMQRIDAERRDETGAGIRAEKWAATFRKLRDAEIAKRRSVKRPVQSPRSSTPTNTGHKTLTEELLSDL
jgi:hypothetical protein